MNRQRHQSHHLAVFAVRFEVGITAINLLKIANQGAEYRLIIRRTDPLCGYTNFPEIDPRLRNYRSRYGAISND
ncbi:DUF2856 family protein [Escherichia coli]|nr:DUF2856 family protein [Escherichia coli]EFN8617188.1 DUF2856 family protein [Escherichia coli H8]